MRSTVRTACVCGLAGIFLPPDSAAITHTIPLAYSCVRKNHDCLLLACCSCVPAFLSLIRLPPSHAPWKQATTFPHRASVLHRARWLLQTNRNLSGAAKIVDFILCSFLRLALLGAVPKLNDGEWQWLALLVGRLSRTPAPLTGMAVQRTRICPRVCFCLQI